MRAREKILIIIIFGLFGILASIFLYTPVFKPRSQVILEETKFIEKNTYLTLPFRVISGTEVEVIVECKTGMPIDLLLVDAIGQDEFERFMNGEATGFSVYHDGSYENVVAAGYTFIFPRTDTWYIIINNAGRVKGGAAPKIDVSVYIKIIQLN